MLGTGREMFIKFYIQADPKSCGYCHFLHNGVKFADGKPFRFCDAFAQEIETDKKDRPLRLTDCVASHISFIDSIRLRFKQRVKDELDLKAEVAK